MRGAEAHAALVRIGKEVEAATSRRWMRRVIHEHAVTDSDRPPMAPAEVSRLEREHVLPVRTGNDLFRLVGRTLTDIGRALRHADASDRGVLRPAPDEDAVQQWLQARLKDRLHQRAHFNRETHVAAEKRPDILIASAEEPVEVAIEVKHGDKKWTLPMLEDRLRVQLATNYLRTPQRRHGYMVISKHRDRRWDHPATRDAISFEDGIAYLQGIAATLTTNETGSITVCVVALDAS
jgi:hypothetical protein